MNSTDQQNLERILKQHQTERVVVIGTTCTGKSTSVASISEAVDMDAVLFPLLTPAEQEYVCQEPWTKEIGKTMIRLAKERIHVEVGKPMFGTVLFNCDFVVYLNISDELLTERCSLRNVNYTNAKNMQESIEREVRGSGIPYQIFDVGYIINH